MLHKCMCSAHADNEVKTKEEEKQSAGKDGGGSGREGGSVFGSAGTMKINVHFFLYV